MDAYEILIETEEPEDVKQIERWVKWYAYRRNKQYDIQRRIPKVRQSMEPNEGQAMFYQEAGSTDVKYGYVYGRLGKKILVQDASGTTLIDEQSGAQQGLGMSKEQAEALAFYYWYMGLTPAKQQAVKKEIERLERLYSSW